MALTFLQRQPDSGLGNIRSSPSARAQHRLGAAARPGGAGGDRLFVIYSASRTKFANPFQFVTRQEIFLIAAVIAMVVVMSIDYERWTSGPRFLYGVTIMLLVLVIAHRHGQRRRPAQLRRRAR